jgi:Holliday junction DNA helicase RuvA
MIASIQGEVLQKYTDNLIIGVGGIGFKVYAPAGLVSQHYTGDQVFLFTYLVVREDALVLYGFQKEEERDFFLLLLGVDGVGPRIALATLSTLSVDAIRRAVLAEQSDVFARVSGVGRKTAQKILIHMQGKVTGETGLGLKEMMDVDTQILEALVGLGYSVVEAQAAIQSIPRDAPADLESRLRIALQFYSS